VTSLQPPVNDNGPPLELTVTQPTDKISVITVNCELDMATSPALGQLLTQELDNGRPVLLVDLSGCEFMSSSGLAVLMAAREHANHTATHLALAGLTRTVTRALDATGLTPLFDIHPSNAEAQRNLSNR
jgi:anti-sigma B factor antagonist